MKLIALTGKMGVGKSTAIEHFKTLLASTANVKFAQPLYDIQEFVYERISGAYQRPEAFVKDRKLLQWIGTEWGRDTISNSLWIDLWKHNVNFVKAYKKMVTCDDCRFDNEAEAVKSMGGIIIKIVSNKTENRIDTTSGIVQHKSEQGVDEKFVDFTVDNSYTVEEFKVKLTEIYLTLLK